jgi:hypothetical protein
LLGCVGVWCIMSDLENGNRGLETKIGFLLIKKADYGTRNVL